MATKPLEIIEVDASTKQVCCDGGDGALGHPAVYYTFDGQHFSIEWVLNVYNVTGLNVCVCDEHHDGGVKLENVMCLHRVQLACPDVSRVAVFELSTSPSSGALHM